MRDRLLHTNSSYFTGSHVAQYLTAAMDNVLASKLGRICLEAASPDQKAGDYIDHGLILRNLLEDEGFYLVTKRIP